MTSVKIDEAIERYVKERKTNDRSVAENRFLSYTYLVCGEGDAAIFMRKVRGLVGYYINYLTVLENPLHGPQAGWLALMSIVFAFGLYMLTNDDLRVAGIFVCTGTLVNGISLARAVIAKWVETAVMIAFYREIVEPIDSTLPAEC